MALLLTIWNEKKKQGSEKTKHCHRIGIRDDSLQGGAELPQAARTQLLELPQLFSVKWF